MDGFLGGLAGLDDGAAADDAERLLAAGQVGDVAVGAVEGDDGAGALLQASVALVDGGSGGGSIPVEDADVVEQRRMVGLDRHDVVAAAIDDPCPSIGLTPTLGLPCFHTDSCLPIVTWRQHNYPKR